MSEALKFLLTALKNFTQNTVFNEAPGSLTRYIIQQANKVYLLTLKDPDLTVCLSQDLTPNVNKTAWRDVPASCCL